MLIAYDNKHDGGNVSTDSAATANPVSYTQHPYLSRKWKTGTGVKSAYCVTDMQAVVTVRVVALLGTNLTSTATIRVRASDTDSTGATGDLYDSTTISSGLTTGYTAIYHVLSTDIDARYWRIDIQDLTVTDNLHVGRIFIGPAWLPSKPALYGWTLRWEDPSAITMSLGGQEFIDALPQYRVLQFTLSYMDEDEMYHNAFEVSRQRGRRHDILVMMRTTGDYLNEESVFGLVSRTTPITHQNLNIFRTQYTIKERL